MSRIEAFAHDVGRGARKQPPRLTVVQSRYAEVAALDLLSCGTGGCASCGSSAELPTPQVRVELGGPKEPKAQKPTGS